MACFTFDRAHDLDVCTPPNRVVRGTFDPEFGGPGTYTVRLRCTASSAVIAEAPVHSADGQPVRVDLLHDHRHAGQGAAFQCTVTCQFDSGSIGAPTPKCLRNDGDGTGPEPANS